MIPGTLVAVALLAATLGPGYVYVRYASDRRPRREQSQLEEIIEMVVIGGSAAVVAAFVVLVAGEAFNAFNTTRIADDPGRYLLTEPARSSLALGVFFGLAYGATYLVARRRYGQESAVSYGSAWQSMFRDRLPDPEKHVALLTVELRDGRKVTGALHSFTREKEDNRELVLIPPMRVQPSPTSKMSEPLGDHFLVLREGDVLYITGRYCWWEKDDPTPRTAQPVSEPTA